MLTVAVCRDKISYEYQRKTHAKSTKSEANAYREKYKWKRNEVNIIIRKAKSDYQRIQEIPTFFGSNKKCISFEGKNVKSEKSLNINGIKSTKSNQIANGFCNYFSNIVSTLNQTSYSLIDFTWRKPLNLPLRTLKSFHFGYVSAIEVTQLLEKMKRNKVAGNDDLLLFPLHIHTS